MTAEKRVKLRGVLAQTASWATIGDDGGLVVELYDFSAEAHTWLGNDVAFLLKIGAAEKGEMSARLLAASSRADAPDDDERLLRCMQERFADYHAVKDWLEDQGIAFRKEFEPWA
ncbi:MAG TPA: hypothetical protein VGC72_15520 [Candidatus Elarobacter sp.]|jgi:hypothetical protein